jgi:LPXTG-motif cell wall-anchored protein
VSVVVSGTCVVLQGGNVARVSVDSITPDGDVVVTIGGVGVAEGATADLALDTVLPVVASSPSGDFAPTTNVASLNVSSAGCDTTPPPVVTQPPALLSALGDLVWLDDDKDGRQGNAAIETPVNGATVTLLSTDGTVLAQQVTGADGLYLFDQLEAGNYRVEVCLAGADFTTTDAPGVADDVDSDVFVLADKPGCARTGIISLPAGVTDLTWDAGIVLEVEGIQIEPTTTTTAPPPVDTVTVSTLPFTGFETEEMVAVSIGALVVGAALLIMARRREDEGVSPVTHSGWTNH